MSTKKEKTLQQQIRHSAFKKLGLILIGLLLVVNTVQLSRLGGIVERVDQYNKGVVDEIGGVRQDVMAFATDLNEIRQFLLLPTKQYSFSNADNATQATDPEEKVSSRTETALYTFLQQTEEDQNFQKNSKLAEDRAKTLLADADFNQQLSTAGLKNTPLETSVDAATFKITDQSANALFAVVFDKKKNLAKMQSALGSYELKSADNEGLKAEIVKYAGDNKQQVAQLKELINKQKNEVVALTKTTEIAPILSGKKLTLKPEESDDSINYSFLNQELEQLLIIQISRKDGQLTLIDNQNSKSSKYQSAAAMSADLITALKNMDTASAEERMINQRKDELTKIFEQEAFKDLLKNSALSIATSPREENNKLLYDAKTADGKVAFSFLIEKSSGSLKILKDNMETDLYAVISDDGLKKKP